MEISGIGKVLLIGGLILGVAGLLFLLAGALGLGKLPGDMAYKRGNVRVYFPLATSIVLSIVATIVLNLLFRR